MFNERIKLVHHIMNWVDFASDLHQNSTILLEGVLEFSGITTMLN